MITDFPPAIVLVIGAILLPFVPKAGQSVFFPVVPLLALGIVALAPDGVRYSTFLFGQEVVMFQMNALARLFGLVFALIGAIAGVYALTLRDTGQRVAALLYMAGAMGVIFAGELLSLFVFSELMAVASTYLIWARRTPEAEVAGWRYLLFHLFGGALLLGGVTWQLGTGADLSLHAFGPGEGFGSWLILAGVCVNAAVPPWHTWLADAYPKATVTGAVFLCAFTTKTAVYVLIRLFPGWEILIYAGLAMILLGGVYGIFSNDTREVLAYSTISQVGFMVTAVGLGSSLALNAAAAHAFCHIIYKALLFMAAGAILEVTGRSRLTDLGGLRHSLPLVCVLYLVGAAAISGVPFLNGALAKTLITAAADDAHHRGVALLLTLGSIATVVHTGLRLPWFVFGGATRTQPARPVPISMHAAMIFLAALCLGFGLFPSVLFQHLPSRPSLDIRSAAALGKAALVVILGGAAFAMLARYLKPRPRSLPDANWFYARSAIWLRRWTVDGLATVFQRCQSAMDWIVAAVSNWASGGQSSETSSYDANASRRPVGLSLTLVVLTVVLVVLWGYLREL